MKKKLYKKIYIKDTYTWIHIGMGTKRSGLEGYMMVLTSSSSFNPLGARVSRVYIQKVSRSHNLENRSASDKLRGIDSRTHTCKPAVDWLWCSKKWRGTLCSSQPSSMNLWCLPNRCRNGRIVRPTYNDLHGHVKQ